MGVLNQFLILDHNSVYLSPCQSSQVKTSSTWDEEPYFKNYWSVSLEAFSRNENCYVSSSLWFESLLDNVCVNLLNWGAVSSFISPYRYWVPTMSCAKDQNAFSVNSQKVLGFVGHVISAVTDLYLHSVKIHGQYRNKRVPQWTNKTQRNAFGSGL